MALELTGCILPAADGIESSVEEAGAAADSAWGEASPGLGAVAFDANIVLAAEEPVSCPGISSFSIAPAAVLVGQAANLAVETIGPAAIVLWTVVPAVGGQFSDAGAAATTFQCSSPGQVRVSAKIGLPDSSVCSGVRFTSFSGLIDCQ